MARLQVQKSSRRGTLHSDVDIILTALIDETGEQWEREFRFHPKRLWRFDYACPAHRIAIEIEGNIFAFGRHNRPMGMIKDMEKYNVATSMGWRIFRFTPPSTGEQLSRFGTSESFDMVKELLKKKEA